RLDDAHLATLGCELELTRRDDLLAAADALDDLDVSVAPQPGANPHTLGATLLDAKCVLVGADGEYRLLGDHHRLLALAERECDLREHPRAQQSVGIRYASARDDRASVSVNLRIECLER